MKNDNSSKHGSQKVPAEKEPMSKASGSSNAPRPDVDDTKRRQPEVKGQSVRTPKQENL